MRAAWTASGAHTSGLIVHPKGATKPVACGGVVTTSTTMSDAVSPRSSGNDEVLASAVAGWLCLAAARAFSIMAVLSDFFGGGMSGMSCSTMQGASLLSGMVPMYLLMSVFPLGPWLKLISRR